MTKDLDETLAELGPEFRSVAQRLRAAPELEPGLACARPPSRVRAAAVLIAASLLVAVGMSVVFGRFATIRQPLREVPRLRVANEYSLAYAGGDEALREIIRTQNADGGWKNDFLTRQNAAALRASNEDRMRVAYRKAVRYLRSRGLVPLSDEELKERGEYAAKTLAGV